MRLLGPKFPNIAEERGRLFVRSTHTDFGEMLVQRDEETWRPWDARRSKLGAAVLKRLSQIGMREGDTVLYLGAAHGYTPSFVCDIVGERGTVFCLDFSSNVVRALLRKSRARENMIPLLADAKRPAEYAWRVTGADVIFMDIAQRDQVSIFLRNCEHFLRDGGFGILALKARSVDMARHPKDVFKEAYQEIERHYKVVDYRELDPFERDHAIFVIKKETPGAKSDSDAHGQERAPVPSHREREPRDERGRGNYQSSHASNGTASRPNRGNWRR